MLRKDALIDYNISSIFYSAKNLLKMFSYTKGLVLLVLVGCTYAYPSGAPSSICGRYAPGHRNENTNVNNPPQGPFRMDVTPMSGGQYRGNVIYILRKHAYTIFTIYTDIFKTKKPPRKIMRFS